MDDSKSSGVEELRSELRELWGRFERMTDVVESTAGNVKALTSNVDAATAAIASHRGALEELCDMTGLLSPGDD